MTLNTCVIDQADAMLIERVRQTNFLYNTQNSDFRLSYKKEKAWQELAENLGIAVMDAKRRWTCLRDRYSRELRLLRARADKRDEYGKSDFFRLMDFLRPFVKKRHARQSPWEYTNGKMVKIGTDLQSPYEDGTQDQYGNKLENIGSDEYNFAPCDLDPIESYDHYSTQVNTLGKSTRNPKTEILPIMASHMPPDMDSGDLSMSQQQVKMEPKLLQFPQHLETEDDFFCKSVAMYLRKLTRRHKIKAKVEIFQILEKFIELEENTVTDATNQYNRHKS